MRLMHRRNALVTRTLQGLAVALLVASCAPANESASGGGTDTASPTSTATSESSPSGSESSGGGGGGGGTVTIGVIRPSTGPLAANGKDMEDGWNLYWDQNGTDVDGTQVKSVFQDTAGKPDIAVNKANQLVTNDKVDMVVGPLSAAAGLAVADALNKQKVVTIMPIVSADNLTQRLDYPYFVRLAGWTSSQTTHPFGEWAYEQGYKKVLTIGYDFAFGYEGVAGFVNTFTDKGGTISKQLWPPLGTQDYSTYVASIQEDNPDAVMVFLSGADQLRFFKAYKDFGLLGKIPLLGGETTTDQSVLQSMGEDAVGLITSGHFAEGRDDPATKDFVDAYFAKFNKYPSYYSANMYTAARGVAEAIKALKGDMSDKEAVVKALRSVDLATTPMGPEKVDDHGNPIFNVYIREVKDGPHGVWNVPTGKTYENVSQFWTYDPTEFLAHPAYSKTYQGNGVWPDPQS